MPLTLDSVVVAAPRQVSSVIGEETVILELEQGVYFSLADAGSRIWELLRDPRSVTALRDAIVAEYDVDAGTAARDLLSLLEEMQGRVGGWLRDGSIRHRESVYDGLAEAPRAMQDMLAGRTAGKTLVRLP